MQRTTIGKDILKAMVQCTIIMGLNLSVCHKHSAVIVKYIMVTWFCFKARF